MKRKNPRNKLESLLMGRSFNKNEWINEVRRLLEERGRLEKKGLFGYKKRKGNTMIREMHCSDAQEWQNMASIDLSGRDVHHAIRARSLVFPSDVTFEGATLHDDCVLAEAVFTEDLYLNTASVKGDVNFAGTTFGGRSNFYGAKFEKVVIFRQCDFIGEVNFTFSHFDRGVNFNAATFNYVPVISDISLPFPPRLDDVEILESAKRKSDQIVEDPREGVFAGRLFKIYRDGSSYIQFQRLKQLAKQAGDHRLYLHFYAEELRARRFWVDAPFWQPRRKQKVHSKEKENEKAGSFQSPMRGEFDIYQIEKFKWQQRKKASSHGSAFRFWLGIIHEKVSSFGRSVGRPLGGLLAISVAFGYMFFLIGSDVPADGRYKKIECDLLKSSATISVNNTFLGLSGTTFGEIERAKNCLVEYFCTDCPGRKAVETIRRGDWLLSLAGSFQKAISAIFIFLIGLSIRNAVKVS